MGKQMVEIREEVGIYPKEAAAKVKNSQNSLLIGVPMETAAQEKRVVLHT
jgi:alanine dehydrogenase